jgi:DNA ligase-1
MKQFSLLEKLVSALNATNSTNDKVKILDQFCNKAPTDQSDFIQKILFYTYNPYYQYFVTPDTLEKYYTEDLGVLYEFNDLFEMLDCLRLREVTGHKAINSVNDFCYKNEEYKDLIYKILGKDLEIRMGDTLINKVVPGLIPTFEVALATDFDKVSVDITNSSWYSSRKLDGVRCLTIVDENGGVTCWSRQGNQFGTLSIIESAIKQIGLTNVVFDGEICLMDKNGNEDFSGIMKEIRRKNHTIKNPKYLIFDYLTLSDFQQKKSKAIYSERLARLHQVIDANSSHLSVCKQTIINDDAHLQSLLQEADSNGWEGLILRRNVTYEGKRSKNMLKCKSFKDAEYEVIDVEFGPFRMIENGLEVTKEVLSNVVIEHRGNKVSVGSGFTIEQREYYKNNPTEILNQIITVKYFQETQNQSGNWSLRFPTIKAIHGKKRTI